MQRADKYEIAEPLLQDVVNLLELLTVATVQVRRVLGNLQMTLEAQDAERVEQGLAKMRADILAEAAKKTEEVVQ